ncbi:exodeoxyribonuclease V subunit gamma [Escherichia coli]
MFQLSSKAADLYDQYLVYRPEWLAQWETRHWLKGWEKHGLASAVVEGAGGIYP